jgi:hypothetical protein
MTKCCIQDCEKVAFARGMCGMHYRRMKFNGDPTKVRLVQLHGATLLERFLHYTEKSEGCWMWVGYTDPRGYGRLNIYGKPVLAHRIAWELFRSEKLTPDQHLCHRCDTPGCVNPDHLFVGDQAANNADMKAKGRMRPGLVQGEAHGCAKLSEDKVLQIRRHSGSPNEIAADFGISRRTVRDIRARRSWSHLK